MKNDANDVAPTARLAVPPAEAALARLQAEIARILSGEFLAHAGHTGGVTAVAFSPDGAVVASGSGDGTVRLWDVASGCCHATFVGLTGDDWIAYTPEGFFVGSPEAAGKMFPAFQREFAGVQVQEGADWVKPNPAKVAEALRRAGGRPSPAAERRVSRRTTLAATPPKQLPGASE